MLCAPPEMRMSGYHLQLVLFRHPQLGRFWLHCLCMLPICLFNKVNTSDSMGKKLMENAMLSSPHQAVHAVSRNDGIDAMTFTCILEVDAVWETGTSVIGMTAVSPILKIRPIWVAM